MEEILKGSPFVNGDVLMAEDMNAIVNGLLDNGSIKLPVVSKEDLNVDKTGVTAESIGWCMFTADGEKIEFAAELPEGATFLGAISAVDASGEDPIITVVAPTSAVNSKVPISGSDWSYVGYVDGVGTGISAVGSYDADGNRLSTETEGVEGTVFTIKASSNSEAVVLDETDSTFIENFGTATAEQRDLAMRKLNGFYASNLCNEYQPAASVINMRGIWRLPLVKELIDAYNLGFDKLVNLNISGNNTWSSLENDSQGAWGVSMSNGDALNINKTNESVVRAFCRL